MQLNSVQAAMEVDITPLYFLNNYSKKGIQATRVAGLVMFDKDDLQDWKAEIVRNRELRAAMSRSNDEYKLKMQNSLKPPVNNEIDQLKARIAELEALVKGEK